MDFCICFSILDLYFDAKIRKNFYTCIGGQVFSVEVRDLCFSKENELFICYFSQLFVILQSVLVKKL